MSDAPVTEAPVTLEELRGVDLFDEIDDAQLAEWVPVARAYQLEPGELIAEQGEPPEGLQLVLEGEAQALLVDQGRTEPVGRHRAPTWMGAIAVLTGGARRGAHAGADRVPDGGRARPRTSAGWRSPSRRSTAA